MYNQLAGILTVTAKLIIKVFNYEIIIQFVFEVRRKDIFMQLQDKWPHMAKTASMQ